MKIKLLILTISSLLIMPICADQDFISREEFEIQLKIKEEQLDALIKRIMELENLMPPMVGVMKEVEKFAQIIERIKYTMQITHIASIVTAIAMVIGVSFNIASFYEEKRFRESL